MSNDEFNPAKWLAAVIVTAVLTILGLVALEFYKFVVCGCPK